MAFDRIATFHISAPGTRDDHGEYIPGPVTDHRIWTDIEDFGETEVEVAGTFRIVRAARFIVRWRADWATTLDSLHVRITDHNGHNFGVTSISDFTRHRRRLLTFQAVGDGAAA